MERLPDDLWLQIFKLGIENHVLDHTDICSLSMTCHHFDQIIQEPDLWTALLAKNSLSSTLLISDQHDSKALFRNELEKKKKNERETEEMFDEVMEFVMWLDNNFLDDEEANSDNDSSRRHADSDNASSGDQAHTSGANTSNRNRSNHACARSFWSTVSTILLPKRSYLRARTGRLTSEQH